MTDVKAIKEYKARWEAVAEVERVELRALTLEQRWQQLILLFRFAQQVSKVQKTPRESQDIIEVRERWNKLKAAYS
ncbi:MAG: hypothetical protein R3C14_35670 [Caldilineaceae bacterium]